MANNYRGMHRASTLFFKLKLPPDYKPPPPKVKRGTEIPPFTEKQLEIMTGNVPNVRRSELTRLVDKLTRMDRGDDVKKVLDMYDHLINPQTTPASKSRYMPDEADGLLQSLTPWTIPGKEVVEMDESKSFPERLKVAIEMSGMSRGEISDKSNIGQGRLSQYISGKIIPRQDSIDALAKVLNVDPGWLAGKTGDTGTSYDLVLLYERLDQPDRRSVYGLAKALLKETKYRA